jgi:hypothetical protein
MSSRHTHSHLFENNNSTARALVAADGAPARVSWSGTGERAQISGDASYWNARLA